jgi:hypothetical protein
MTGGLTPRLIFVQSSIDSLRGSAYLAIKTT